MSNKSPPLSKNLPQIPGAFNPKDYIDFYEDPFDALDQLQQAWRNKEHARPWSVLPELDLTDVDWHKYSPSVVMRTAPDVTSEILLKIIQSSVLNVQARVDEEERQKKEIEQRQAAEEAERRNASKTNEPYLPIIMVQDTETLLVSQDEIRDARPRVDDEPNPVAPNMSLDVRTIKVKPTSMGGLIVLPTRGEKKKKFNLRKLLARVSEKGGSNMAGQKREILRTRIKALAETAGDDLDDKTKAIVERSKAIGLFSHQDKLGQAEEQLVECVSCLDDFSTKETIKVPCHSYCRDCFVRLINASIATEQQWPPKCCLNEIPRETILNHIPKELGVTFREHAFEMEVPLSQRLYCNEPACCEWIRPDKTSQRKRQGWCSRGHMTCTLCHGAAHGKGECPQDQDMNLTNALAEEEGWKRCYSCHALVEHAEACQHMTCRCGTQFCYVCGLRWRTCSCTMQQLDAVKQAAQDRREVRLLRETQEAQELRQILAQIEEFEKEEALKAELLRQEQERLEAERQQKELEERVRVETLRRQGVERKYEELRGLLGVVRNLQAELLKTQQDEDAVIMSNEIIAAKKKLQDEQEAARASYTESMAVKISTYEKELQSDYVMRATAEKKIEEEYHQDLRAFWDTKPDGEAQVEAAMSSLRRKMDRGYKAYQQWNLAKLETYKEHLEEQQMIKEELMYSAKHRMDDLHEAKEADLVKRMVAEKKWMEEIVRERERLLGEKEVEEMEGDADSLFAAERGASPGGDSFSVAGEETGSLHGRNKRDTIEDESAWFSADEEFGEPQGPVDNGEGSWRAAAAAAGTAYGDEEEDAGTWDPARGGIREAGSTAMEEVAREFKRDIHDPWIGMAY